MNIFTVQEMHVIGFDYIIVRNMYISDEGINEIGSMERLILSLLNYNRTESLILFSRHHVLFDVV